MNDLYVRSHWTGIRLLDNLYWSKLNNSVCQSMTILSAILVSSYYHTCVLALSIQGTFTPLKLCHVSRVIDVSKSIIERVVQIKNRILYINKNIFMLINETSNITSSTFYLNLSCAFTHQCTHVTCIIHKLLNWIFVSDYI